MLTIEKIKEYAALALACEKAKEESEWQVAGFCTGGVHLSADAFKALYGQGDVIARGTDEYPYEHVTIIDGVRVYCIGGEVI